MNSMVNPGTRVMRPPRPARPPAAPTVVAITATAALPLLAAASRHRPVLLSLRRRPGWPPPPQPRGPV